MFQHTSLDDPIIVVPYGFRWQDETLYMPASAILAATATVLRLHFSTDLGRALLQQRLLPERMFFSAVGAVVVSRHPYYTGTGHHSLSGWLKLETLVKRALLMARIAGR